MDSVLVKDIRVYLIVLIGDKYTFIHWPVFPKNTFNGWRKIWNLIGSIINLKIKDLQILPKSALKPLSFAFVGWSLSAVLAGKAYQLIFNSSTSQDKWRKVSFPSSILSMALKKNCSYMQSQGFYLKFGEFAGKTTSLDTKLQVKKKT